MIETMNAVITYAKITNDDHGLLTAYIGLSYGDGGAQAFGGYSLYLPKSFTHSKREAGYAGHFIWRVLEVAGVSEWSELVGKTVRARAEHSKVHAIGHIIKNDWFCPAEEFRALEATNA